MFVCVYGCFFVFVRLGVTCLYLGFCVRQCVFIHMYLCVCVCVFNCFRAIESFNVLLCVCVG